MSGSDVEVSWAGCTQGGASLSQATTTGFASFLIESPPAGIWCLIEDQQQLWLGVIFHDTSMNKGCDTLIPSPD